MSISEKIIAINNKIEQNKAQYHLDRQTAKISALSQEDFSKYEFFTGKDVLPEKDLLEEAAATKIFEYSPLGQELKKETSFAEKQYQKLDNDFESNKKEEDKRNNRRSRAKSNLLYNNCFTLYKYRTTKKCAKRSFDLKGNDLM